MNEFCQLQLTCKDKAEAENIANALLGKHLVACARQIPVSSTYRWQGKIETSEEVMLLMESKPNLFEKVEKELAKLHSYDTFVLEAVELKQISKKAKLWLDKESLNVK